MAFTVKDHPRPCGEQANAEKQQVTVLGSPPPMRGTAMGDMPSTSPSRITPAHAGNSVTDPNDYIVRRDHPRPCGEQVNCIFTCAYLPGSPPPMRGTA